MTEHPHPAPAPDRSSTPAELRIPTKPGDLPAIMAAQRTLESIEARELEETQALWMYTTGAEGSPGIYRYSPTTGQVHYVTSLTDLQAFHLLERRLPWR